MIQDSFDPQDPKNIGRPIYFRLDKYIESIEMMIRADELQLAIYMCDNPPAWFRQNYPPELQVIKDTLYQNLYDSMEYVHDDEEANCTREFGEAQWTNGYMFPRAEIITSIVKGYNSEGRVPWIFDLGCSHGNLPLGLLQSGLDFTYFGHSLNYRINQKVKEWVGDKWRDRHDDETERYHDNPDELAIIGKQPTILYCTEVLEHCMNPMDIVQSAYKVGVSFDVILLSVPLGCLGGGLPDWSTRRLGHVRGYSPKEFADFAMKNWPGYTWEMTIAPSMVLVGEKQK